MILTYQSDRIEDFLHFYADSCGNSAVADRNGASEDAISQLQELCRFALPPFFIAYLREFGERDGRLNVGDDGDARVSRLIEYYSEQRTKKRNWVPENCVLFSLEGLGGGRALYYGADSSLVEPLIVSTWNSTIGVVRGECFCNYAYRQALVRGRYERKERQTVLHSEDKGLTKIAADFAQTIGFSPYWFSDAYQACLEREDVFLSIRQAEDGTHRYTNIYITSQKESDRKEITSNFVNRFGLRDISPKPKVSVNLAR